MLIFLLTVPVVGYFIYSVIQDPVTPTVMKNAWDVIKLKYFGYISQFTNTDKKIEAINKKNNVELNSESNVDVEDINVFKTS